MTHQGSSQSPVPQPPALTSREYAGLLRGLREQWRTHQRNGLVARYNMGKLLNAQLGDPAGRQAYGKGLVVRVSEYLRIDKTDISRFRRFAAKFETFEEFELRHPEVCTWTSLRDLLAKPGRRPVTGNRTVQGLLRSAQTSIESLRRLDTVHGPKVDQLRSALQELFELAHGRLGIDFTLSDEKTGSNPDLHIAKAHAKVA